jgi:hypothetical protein
MTAPMPTAAEHLARALQSAERQLRDFYGGDYDPEMTLAEFARRIAERRARGAMEDIEAATREVQS